jgi:hypothetical protein
VRVSTPESALVVGMATMPDIHNDIEGAIGFLTRRSGSAGSTVGERLASNISSKLMQLHYMSATDADELLALLDGSPFSETAMRVLTSAIESRLVSPLLGGPMKSNFKCQLLTKCNLWFTEHEWIQLKDKSKSWELKVELVLHRFRQIGCVNPHEQTFKWLLALLLQSHYEVFPSYRTVFALLADLKTSFTTLTFEGYPFPYIASYPECPTQLPA